jgi:prepilin-type N-terminal cleavage/methylation domain-containing protein
MKKIHFSRSNIRARSRGFTLVETLVAITILMVSIAGPLVIATKGLTSSGYAKNQMIASFLAQESMEVIKNKRDNNLVNKEGGQINSDWLVGITDLDEYYIDASGVGQPFKICSEPIIGIGCPIYYSSDTGYTNSNSSNSIQTQFYRYYSFQDFELNSGQEEVVVRVYVNWKEGSVPFQISLVSNIVATKR